MAKLSILQFIRDQYKTVPPVVTVDLSGKTVLVVGANTGLGLEAAKHFASMNPEKLLLACRNAEKGKRAIEGIQLPLVLGTLFIDTVAYPSYRSRYWLHKVRTANRRSQQVFFRCGICQQV